MYLYMCNIMSILLLSSGAAHYPIIKIKWVSCRLFPILSYYEGKTSLFMDQAHFFQPLMARLHSVPIGSPLLSLPFQNSAYSHLNLLQSDFCFCSSHSSSSGELTSPWMLPVEAFLVFTYFSVIPGASDPFCSSLKSLDIQALHSSNYTLTFLTPCF